MVGHPRARTGLAVAALTLVPLVSACGDQGRTAAYPADVARQLQADVADVRAAAQRRKLRVARAALHRLTRHVADAQASGQLPARRAREILAAADAVTEDLAALPTPAPAPDRDERPKRPRAKPKREQRPDEPPGGEKPEGWEAHKGDGDKPEGWEAHKNED